VQLQSLLARMLDAGCTYVFMEVSSHALAQERLAGTFFTGAVFTNLSHDHLDYHGDFKAYLTAKKKLFDTLLPQAFALINADDKNASVMVQNTRAEVYRYGLRQMADFKAKVLSADVYGMELLMDGVEVHTPLSGEYNAYNLLAAYATARLLDMDKQETLAALSGLQGAEGRMQKVQVEGSSILGIVDYAHTPDALEKVLLALRAALREDQKLICVVGAGGDRDKAKRPKMAAIAARNSDQLILTSDNPRFEEPDAILRDMEAGLQEAQRAKTLIIADRRQAIRTAVSLAKEGDVILVAGKGHEKYQSIKGEKHPFDDVEELLYALYSMQSSLIYMAGKNTGLSRSEQLEKAGTPTMGGLIIIMSILIPTLLMADLKNIYVQLMLLSTVWMGVIGFIDDYIMRKPCLPITILSAWWKLKRVFL